MHPKPTSMNLFTKLFFSAAAVTGSLTAARAQQVPKTVIAEHFTNTLCSVCASRNPGFYSNLWNYPQVLHVAYHPSSPYAGCTLSMANPAENDARTNFYGLYGGTPTLAVQGLVVSGTFTDASIFTSKLAQLTSFSMRITTTAQGADSVKVVTTIKKVDTSSVTNLQFYGLVAEDTLNFTSGNGEAHHYDVFRQSLSGTTSVNVSSLVSVGDSFMHTKVLAIKTTWTRNKLFAVGILQDNSKNVLQAAKSGHIPSAPSAVTTLAVQPDVNIYPNPATDKLFIEGDFQLPIAIAITDSKGAVVVTQKISTTGAIDISALKPGVYFIHIDGGQNSPVHKFLKN